MTKPRISQVLLWALALVTLALFGFFVALVAGALPVDDPPAPPDTGALSQTEPAEEPATTAVTKRVRATTPPPPASTTDTAHARNRDRQGDTRGLLDLGPPRL